MAASPEQALALTLDVAADATVYVPAPRIASASSASAGGRGFLVVFGAIRASAPGDSPAAVHIDGVRARATRSDERVRVAALLDPAAADELPGVAPRLVAESPPAFLVIAA